MEVITQTSRRLNVDEAAMYCGLSTSSMNKMRVSGDGPMYYKLGRRVMYEQRELDRWLDSKRRTKTDGHR